MSTATASMTDIHHPLFANPEEEKCILRQLWHFKCTPSFFNIAMEIGPFRDDV